MRRKQIEFHEGAKIMKQLQKDGIGIKIGVLISILAIFFLYLGFFTNLELITLDYRFIIKYLFTDQPSNLDVVLVTIDRQSLTELGDWPWSRRYHAEVIDNLTAAGAKVMGVDLIFNNGDPARNLADRNLVQATQNSSEIIYPVVLNLEITRSWLRYQQDQIRVQGRELPFPELAKQATGLGYINLIIDRDGLVRKLPFLKAERKHATFSYQIANKFLGKVPTVDEKGLINYVGPARSFPTISYNRVLNNDFSKKLVKNKIVLVGATAPGLGDKYMTPYSTFGAMSGLEVHANAIQTLLNNNQITRVNFKLIGLVILIIGLFNSCFFIKTKPGFGALILLTEIIIILSLVISVFISYNLWLDLIPVLFNIISIYLVVLAYHYFWADQRQIQLKENFAHYLPSGLVAEILRHPDQVKLGGKRQEVTVLFADIRGFTSYTEEHIPEQVVEKVNQYLALMTESILDFDGMLDKYVGDGIMAVFGVPLTDEEHLKKAIQAALRIQTAVQKSEQELKVGIGISRGEVIAGNIGSKKRMDYTVIGDAVNLAARLEELAGPGQILLSTRDYRLVESQVEAELINEVQIKGKQSKFEIYNLKELHN